MERRQGWTYRGCAVVDAHGAEVGTVADVWPQDGGGEPEMVLVNVGRRLSRRRFLPLDGRPTLDGRTLRVPWERWQIVDAPDAEDGRWGHPAHLARAFWRDASD
jgi:PRC-barrel domain protein